MHKKTGTGAVSSIANAIKDTISAGLNITGQLGNRTLNGLSSVVALPAAVTGTAIDAAGKTAAAVLSGVTDGATTTATKLGNVMSDTVKSFTNTFSLVYRIGSFNHCNVMNHL